jgi:hypothetical protein
MSCKRFCEIDDKPLRNFASIGPFIAEPTVFRGEFSLAKT